MTLKHAQVATVAPLVALSVGGCAGTQIAVDPQWTPVVVIVALTADPGEVAHARRNDGRRPHTSWLRATRRRVGRALQIDGRGAAALNGLICRRNYA
ncbi:MAG: hypothetical protein WKH64_08110 [Chloroflexia bacterium]